MTRYPVPISGEELSKNVAIILNLSSVATVVSKHSNGEDCKTANHIMGIKLLVELRHLIKVGISSYRGSTREVTISINRRAIVGWRHAERGKAKERQ